MSVEWDLSIHRHNIHTLHIKQIQKLFTIKKVIHIRVHTILREDIIERRIILWFNFRIQSLINKTIALYKSEHSFNIYIKVTLY
jgi:hypothetical protein